MAEHEQLAADLGLQVFCGPKSLWQRGSNENTNRLLLRQYLAKGADTRVPTADQLQEMAARVNTRSRKVLGWDTAARFRAHLPAAGVA